MTPEPYASIIHAAQLNIVVSVVNMLTTALLIHGTLMLRKATRLNNETRRLIEERRPRLDLIAPNPNSDRDRNG